MQASNMFRYPGICSVSFMATCRLFSHLHSHPLQCSNNIEVQKGSGQLLFSQEVPYSSTNLPTNNFMEKKLWEKLSLEGYIKQCVTSFPSYKTMYLTCLIFT